MKSLQIKSLVAGLSLLWLAFLAHPLAPSAQQQNTAGRSSERLQSLSGFISSPALLPAPISGFSLEVSFGAFLFATAYSALKGIDRLLKTQSFVQEQSQAFQQLYFVYVCIHAP